jgi:glucose/arabinose dehydrogenase
MALPVDLTSDGGARSFANFPGGPGQMIRPARQHLHLRATRFGGALAILALTCAAPLARLRADSKPVGVKDANLQVTTAVSGLTQPIGMLFLPRTDGAIDMLVIEKASGQVKRVINGVVQGTPVLDLAVNSASERGLLDITLHPNFPATPDVFVRWTESATGADSSVISETPLLGNRVDRFVWNGSTLTLAGPVIALRARQTDNIAVNNHPGTNNANENGNHNGGVMRFGPDGKLYIFMGDNGRRGWMQNLPNGPFLTSPLLDDTFGGPAADNPHFTGVVLRLNTDGSAPTDNPFFTVGAQMGGEVGANLQKIYSYGHRNGFGMAFDHLSGSLWVTENGDDSFSELNRTIPGMNGGWIQIMGPLARYAQYKDIETTQYTMALQQVRYPPTRLGYTSALALARMFTLPGATYVDPDFSWRYEIGPAGAVFVNGDVLGAEYNGTLWIGSARSFQQVGGTGGSLYRFQLNPDRLHVNVSADPRLADRVADNLFSPTKFEGTESESLIIGEGFGITTDIEQGPDGLYVVSNTDNVIYKISRRPGMRSGVKRRYSE